MDQELIAYLDEHFRETSRQIERLREETTQQIAGLREETTRRFEQIDGRFEQIDGRFERMEEAIRQTGVEVENLRDEVRLVAEGVVSVGQRLESFRGEVAREFDAVRGLIRPAYSALADRVQALEGWRELKERDPVDIIRERYRLGKDPSSTE